MDRDFDFLVGRGAHPSFCEQTRHHLSALIFWVVTRGRETEAEGRRSVTITIITIIIY